MASCNYHVLNDLYQSIDTKLEDIASKIEGLELDINIDELDLDLDNLEKQLKIANKLQLLDAIGTDIMSEEEQTAAYQSIRNELFSPTVSGGTMTEEDGEF